MRRGLLRGRSTLTTKRKTTRTLRVHTRSSIQWKHKTDILKCTTAARTMTTKEWRRRCAEKRRTFSRARISPRRTNNGCERAGLALAFPPRRLSEALLAVPPRRRKM
jgi:hypothetical protein